MAKHLFCLFASGALVTSQVVPIFAATAPTQDNVRYVGAVTCQSSMCHGGASPSRDQFTIWSHADFHSRSYATLVTARSVQIAAGAGIADATKSPSCTVCHAPLAGHDLAPTATVTEGVSCEACHGGAAAWLRSHTRPDYSYANRVQAGMRDMRSAFVRANTCVACHQVIDPALIKAGHPELTFELDGQAASEPRHWTEKADWFGPKAWIVGQAVALREVCRQSLKARLSDRILREQTDAISWVLFRAGFGPATLEEVSSGDTEEEYAAWSNQLAQNISAHEWTSAMTQKTLTGLAGSSLDFTHDGISPAQSQLRAERLVLGLDRLFKALHGNDAAPGSAELAALFDSVQDRTQFDPQKFSGQLQKFADAIK